MPKHLDVNNAKITVFKQQTTTTTTQKPNDNIKG